MTRNFATDYIKTEVVMKVENVPQNLISLIWNKNKCDKKMWQGWPFIQVKLVNMTMARHLFVRTLQLIFDFQKFI